MNKITRYLFIGLCCGMLAACGNSERRAVSETRTVMPSDSPPAPAASSADQSGLPPGHPAVPKVEGKPLLTWQAPAGWQDAGTKGLRLANFTAGAGSEAECYVTVLGGTGGGVALNVNRWRAQLGLPEASPDEIAALPKIPMLGGEAVFVDIAGTYGVTGDDDVHTGVETARQDYGLLGAIVVRGSDAVFVKMTGPLEIVRAERANFTAFAGSIKEAGAVSNESEK